MTHKMRKGLLILMLLVGLWLMLAAVAFADVVPANHRGAVELTPIVTPTATPTSFPTELALITITVIPSSTGIVVGDRLTVSVHIDNQPRACSFAMYDLTLRQPFSDTQWFKFLSPERLGPPAPTDAEFTLQAINSGAIRLTASLRRRILRLLAVVVSPRIFAGDCGVAFLDTDNVLLPAMDQSLVQCGVNR